MKKIHSQLIQIYDEIKKNNKFFLPEKYLENEKMQTDNKLEEYKTNNNIRTAVIPCIVDIYNKHVNEIIAKHKEIRDDKINGF